MGSKKSLGHRRFSHVLLIVFVFSLFCASPGYGKDFNLKLQSFQAGWQYSRSTKPFVSVVERLSRGSVKIKAFPVGALVPVMETLEAVRSGVLDIAFVPEGYFAGQVPVSLISSALPYAFDSMDEAEFFMYNRGFIDILQQEYAKQGLHWIPMEVYPSTIMTKKPINKIEDLKGVKIRAYGTMAEWLRECGASTVFIPYGEMYTALATGVAEGACMGDAGPMYEMKLHEILKYYLTPEPSMGCWWSMIVNKKLWESFSSEQKDAVEAAALINGRSVFKHTRVMTQRALKEMKEKFGIKVTVLPPAEREKAKALAMKTWQKIASKDKASAKVIEMIEQFQKEKEVYVEAKLPWVF